MDGTIIVVSLTIVAVGGSLLIFASVMLDVVCDMVP